jgi:PleD family two-component response regulator
MSRPTKLEVGGISTYLENEESYNYLQSEKILMTQILAITSDLFLQSRIGELVRSLGKTAKIVTTENDLITDTGSNEPELVILDLASSDYDPFSCARKLKEMPVPPKIMGMFPHIRTDLRVRAQEVGVDYIVPNSSFLKTLKTILEKGVSHS